jgi:hypothetical protein
MKNKRKDHVNTSNILCILRLFWYIYTIKKCSDFAFLPQLFSKSVVKMQFLIVLLPQLFTKAVVNLQNLKFRGYITIRHENCGENTIENY